MSSKHPCADLPMPRGSGEATRASSSPRGMLLKFLATGSLFFLAAHQAFLFSRATDSIAIIWPAVGISMAFTWLWGPWMIPASILGDLAATLFFAPPAKAALFACGNGLALLLARALMARHNISREFYLVPRDMFLFLAASLVLSAVSSVSGTAAEHFLSGLPEGKAPQIWWLWLIGDFTGAIFVAPLIVAWASRGVRATRSDLIQPAAILSCIVVIAALFLQNESFFSEGYPVPFLIMPFLVWAAFCMGYRELYTFLTVLGAIAIATTNAGIGLFSIYSHVQSMLLLQSYMVICALTAIVLHCVVSSRKTAYLSATLSRDALVMSLADLAELRDSGTGAHLARTQRYVGILCEKLRQRGVYRDLLGDEDIDLTVKTAPLHDIGKVAVPDAILLKPGRLDPGEFAVIRKHPESGEQILRRASRFLGGGRFLDVARDIVLHHHEKWDGTGYPGGLKGEAIPLPARLMALADVYDALTTTRVYKQAITHREAAAILVEGSGVHFDPAVVDAFLAGEKDFEEISAGFSREPEGQGELQAAPGRA